MEIVKERKGKESQDMVRFLDGPRSKLIDSSGWQLELERAHTVDLPVNVPTQKTDLDDIGKISSLC